MNSTDPNKNHSDIQIKSFYAVTKCFRLMSVAVWKVEINPEEGCNLKKEMQHGYSDIGVGQIVRRPGQPVVIGNRISFAKELSILDTTKLRAGKIDCRHFNLRGGPGTGRVVGLFERLESAIGCFEHLSGHDAKENKGDLWLVDTHNVLMMIGPLHPVFILPEDVGSWLPNSYDTMKQIMG